MHLPIPLAITSRAQQHQLSVFVLTKGCDFSQVKSVLSKKFWEELIAYFPMI
jgi:hypothetical protein